MEGHERRLGNLTAVTITFDFRTQEIIYSVRLHKRVSPEAILRRAGEQGLVASSQVVLRVKRTLTGRIELSFGGPAIQHIYKALPIFGTRTMTAQLADTMRERADRGLRHRTTLFVRDLNKLVVLLCSP